MGRAACICIKFLFRPPRHRIILHASSNDFKKKKRIMAGLGYGRPKLCYASHTTWL